MTTSRRSASSNSRIKEWAEWGHNRDNERMGQMNIGLVTDRHGVPAMFELYPGPISDVKTLEPKSSECAGYGAVTIPK